MRSLSEFPIFNRFLIYASGFSNIAYIAFERLNWLRDLVFNPTLCFRKVYFKYSKSPQFTSLYAGNLIQRVRLSVKIAAKLTSAQRYSEDRSRLKSKVYKCTNIARVD